MDVAGGHGTGQGEDRRPASGLAGNVPPGDDATVVLAVDGDTPVVGNEQRVRLMGSEVACLPPA